MKFTRMGRAPGVKVWLHNSHHGTEDHLVHCKARRDSSWCRSRDLGWDSHAHCWLQRGPCVVAECTRACPQHSMCSRAILTPPSFCSRPQIVPASWQALKLTVPTGRKWGNTVFIPIAIMFAQFVTSLSASLNHSQIKQLCLRLNAV